MGRIFYPAFFVYLKKMKNFTIGLLMCWGHFTRNKLNELTAFYISIPRARKYLF